jgi:hypothetical protein
VLEAISYGESDYLAGELLQIAENDYSILKNDIDIPSVSSETAVTDPSIEIKSDKSQSFAEKAQRLKDDINALKNKRTKEAAEFLKTMLSEEYLTKAEEILPKGKKQAYYYKTLEESALEALYRSGKGNDFIWKMFKDTQEGLLSKIIKKPAKQKKQEISKTLNYYAFMIGAKIIDHEEFYNTFFKTNLYKDIAKHDHCAFEDCFLQENSPAFSNKIAHYFAEMGDYTHISLACDIVLPEDKSTLNILAGHLKKNLEKNSYSYNNYEIIKKLGECKHKSFKELYELYCAKYNNNTEDAEYLQQLLSEL